MVAEKPLYVQFLEAQGAPCAAANLSRVIVLSIPSPGDPFLIKAGGFQVRWYGLLLAAGVLIAGWVARREFRRRGFDPELAYSIAVWTVPLGLIGARLYHVVTDWAAFQHHLIDMFKIWKGGLGIYGAILGGMLGTWERLSLGVKLGVLGGRSTASPRG